jgi:hypothetical protein
VEKLKATLVEKLKATLWEKLKATLVETRLNMPYRGCVDNIIR